MNFSQKLTTKIIVLFLISYPIYAKDKGIFFKDMPLEQFLEIYYGTIEKRPYVIAAQLKDKSITISVEKSNYSMMINILDQVLYENGLDRHLINGVTVIRDMSPDRPNIFIYEPKYRKVSYLSNMLRSSFVGKFNNIRGNQSSSMTNYDSDKSKGSNAYSNIDVVTDLLVYSGSKYDISRLKEVLEQIDIPKKEILVNAKIYEYSKVNDKESAISVIGKIIKGSGYLLTSQIGIVNSNFIKLTSINNIEAIASSISSNSNFKTLSSPVIRVSHGQMANLISGTETPILSSIVTENGSSKQSVDYKEAGIILKVKPIISKIINLNIDLEVSYFKETKNGVNNTPTLIKRKIKTDIQLNENEIILIGGLNNEKENNIKTKLLGFIPINDKKLKENTELIIMLTVKKIII